MHTWSMTTTQEDVPRMVACGQVRGLAKGMQHKNPNTTQGVNHAWRKNEGEHA
jgi:hypothetical protein